MDRAVAHTSITITHSQKPSIIAHRTSTFCHFPVSGTQWRHGLGSRFGQTLAGGSAGTGGAISAGVAGGVEDGAGTAYVGPTSICDVWTIIFNYIDKRHVICILQTRVTSLQMIR